MEINELAIQAEIEAAKVGVKDWEVWAAVHYAMTRNGSELPIHCFWVSGKNPKRTLTRPSMRLLERGDVIINEIEASWIGYRAQGVQPVFVEVINPVQAELIKVQREIFNRVIESLKPGVTVAELAELTKRTARAPRQKAVPAAGARGELNMHGRGQGDDGPIITPHAKKSTPVGGRDAREYGFHLQTVGSFRRRRIYLPVGRYGRGDEEWRTTARQAAA